MDAESINAVLNELSEQIDVAQRKAQELADEIHELGVVQKYYIRQLLNIEVARKKLPPIPDKLFEKIGLSPARPCSNPAQDQIQESPPGPRPSFFRSSPCADAKSSSTLNLDSGMPSEGEITEEIRKYLKQVGSATNKQIIMHVQNFCVSRGGSIDGRYIMGRLRSKGAGFIRDAKNHWTLIELGPGVPKEVDKFSPYVPDPESYPPPASRFAKGEYPSLDKHDREQVKEQMLSILRQRALTIQAMSDELEVPFGQTKELLDELLDCTDTMEWNADTGLYFVRKPPSVSIGI